jgi:hypothetical protein
MKRVQIAFIALVSLMASSVVAMEQKPAHGNVWDAGSFGIFLNGKRVGTERFEIQQKSSSSLTVSEFDLQSGKFKADQKAEMELQPNGDLKSYDWQETVPQKEESKVDVKDQLLVEHVIPAGQKEVDIPHFLSSSTVILDDNFFSQREVLLWHYLATCSRKPAELACKPKTFAVLIPQQHTSLNATMRLLGEEKVEQNGLEQELTKVELDMRSPQQIFWLNEKTKDPDTRWILWADEHYRIIKFTVPGTNIQVLRDPGTNDVSMGSLQAPQK